MSTVKLNGTTVYVSAIESVEDGVSHEYDTLWNRAAYEILNLAWQVGSVDEIAEKQAKIELPKEADYPAVIVKLTSGREFRIVGRSRGEVEQDILWAKRRDRA